MKRFVFVMFACACLFCLLPSCKKSNEATIALNGTYELRAVERFAMGKTYLPGNDTMIVFCGNTYERKIKGVVKQTGSFKIEHRKVKDINYCNINDVFPNGENKDVYLLTLQGQDERSYSLSIENLPEEIRITSGCFYDDTGITEVFVRIAASCR